MQSMPDCSPTRWHLGHTTWFFEYFVLRSHLRSYRAYDDRYDAIFNSYYRSIGTPLPRTSRGLLSRPSLRDVHSYRERVDGAMDRLLAGASLPPDILARIEIGLHHERQHQELILTDILHAFGSSPLRPAYRDRPSTGLPPPRTREPCEGTWIEHPGGEVEVGADSAAGFAFDNESPRHAVRLDPFAIGSRLVTNGEFREFMQDGGYRRPDLWLSDGWDFLSKSEPRIEMPLYWRSEDPRTLGFTLDGEILLEPESPVAHVSFYEADAYARWRGCRLPTEFEWEAIASALPIRGNFLESGLMRAAAAEPSHANGPAQLYGDLWEWTQSAYLPYPRFKPRADALGEYNGKFMCNQMVLRGGSFATPLASMRSTYRNFFPPATRWQFSGIRLASDRA